MDKWRLDGGSSAVVRGLCAPLCLRHLPQRGEKIWDRRQMDGVLEQVLGGVCCVEQSGALGGGGRGVAEVGPGGRAGDPASWRPREKAQLE